MTKFQQMRADIRAEYPLLPWYLKLFIGPVCEQTITRSDSGSFYAMSFLTTTYKSKEYLLRFGTLR